MYNDFVPCINQLLVPLNMCHHTIRLLLICCCFFVCSSWEKSYLGHLTCPFIQEVIGCSAFVIFIWFGST